MTGAWPTMPGPLPVPDARAEGLRRLEGAERALARQYDQAMPLETAAAHFGARLTLLWAWAVLKREMEARHANN